MDEHLNLDFSLDFEIPRIELRETTVGRLAGERVGCGNIYHGSYHSDNQTQTGLCCELVLAATEYRWTVGTGSEFTIADKKFKVVEIVAKTEEERGKVIISEL